VSAGVTFVVNDDVEAALELGAEGVHLGSGDEGIDRARKAGLLVGPSTRRWSQTTSIPTISVSVRSGRRRSSPACRPSASKGCATSARASCRR
jgi:hypothetical protein